MDFRDIWEIISLTDSKYKDTESCLKELSEISSGINLPGPTFNQKREGQLYGNLE
jgi:hypothetical protein